jgi:uncharacterized protein YqjF (DUF2071 family)
MSESPTNPFLTARWEHLILLNYVVPEKLLEPLVPRGTKLDRWQGETLVSLVGFLFVDTRLRGIPVPGHRHFEEVNLRFYVTREVEEGVRRRAVVFIRELVPRWAIAALARWVYNEPYLAVPMRHAVAVDPEQGGRLRYQWQFRGESYALEAIVNGPAQELVSGSLAEFITEHHWGYTRQRDGGTIEYRVERPPWRVWSSAATSFAGRAGMLYGQAFDAVLSSAPSSAFVALGSPVTVSPGRRVA